MSNEVDSGKEWIAQRIQTLAEEFKVPVEKMEWLGFDWRQDPGKGIGQADSTYYFLEIIIDGQRRKKKFIEEDLEDLLGDHEVQKRTMKSLREMFEPFKKDQIGFNPR